jgi:GT2 family glycosyltransferase
MSDTSPLVSIIIPCFNYARYLPAAIESALAQTYRPIEVIVVDDGSTDGSLELARDYSVQVLAQSNQGLAASTNNGVQAGSGEFFLRLDADDVLYPAFVETTLAALTSHPDAALAFAPGEYFGLRSGLFECGPLQLEALAQGAYVTCCSLMRRSAWQAVGGLDRTIPLCEDWDLWLKYAERGFSGVSVPGPLWGYRKHGPSMVHRSLRSHSDVLREYRLIAHLQDHHPTVFAPHLLVQRLLRAPLLVARGEMSARTSVKLLAFYTVMLARAISRVGQRSRPMTLSGRNPAR